MHIPGARVNQSARICVAQRGRTRCALTAEVRPISFMVPPPPLHPTPSIWIVPPRSHRRALPRCPAPRTPRIRVKPTHSHAHTRIFVSLTAAAV